MTAPATRPERVASVLVLIVGVLTLGIAIYFLFVRPPMLPEDVRFTGVSESELPPPFAAWLTIVFRTWGGFVAGLGIMLIAIGAYLLVPRRRMLQGGIALAIVVAFGRFLLSNIELRSDFLPFLVVVSVVVAGTAVSLLVSALR
jgi:hypothetical protein